MSKILHIETATKVCSVALSENGNIVERIENEEEGFSHAENLNLFIVKALDKAGWKLSQLNAVSVTSGPGSYTGLRIGVSTAKGLCYALNIPLISVNALESISALAREKHQNKSICAVIDARRMEVFSLITDRNNTIVKAISADVIEENTYSAHSNLVICGDGAEKLQGIWKNRDFIFETNIKSSAGGQCKIAYEKYSAKQFEDVAYFEPFYLKDFIAVKAKKRV
ncbi:MAG: tRNA (adenosine(37)-N6)-threonylcarbamoyltransferase complex dimerization subunit type 1 TsaB [Lishizhenia sp.]